MKVNIVGRHVKVTPAMQEYAREKANKLDRFFAGIRHVDMVMDVVGLMQQVEIGAVLGRGARLVGKAEAEDMYAAIDQAEARLEKQVRRFHARLKAHRDRTRVAEGRPTGEEEGTEATYEQVVREMLEDGED